MQVGEIRARQDHAVHEGFDLRRGLPFHSSHLLGVAELPRAAHQKRAQASRVLRAQDATKLLDIGLIRAAWPAHDGSGASVCSMSATGAVEADAGGSPLIESR